MANIVIVTKQCYLLCQAIVYVAVNETYNGEEKEDIFYRPKKPKKLTKKQQQQKKDAEARAKYQIIIEFIPINNSSNNIHNNMGPNGTCTLAISVTGKEECLGLFASMVGQIREQIPDQLWLDTLVQRFLTEQTEGA